MWMGTKATALKPAGLLFSPSLWPRLTPPILLFPLSSSHSHTIPPLTWGSQGEQEEGSKDKAEEPHGWRGAGISARLEQERAGAGRCECHGWGSSDLWGREEGLGEVLLLMAHCTAWSAALPPCWQNSALPRPAISPRFKGKPPSVTGAAGMEQMFWGRRTSQGARSVSQAFPNLWQGCCRAGMWPGCTDSSASAV